MPRLLFVFLLPLLCADAFAQGFRSVNGRNHPELDWQVAETEHFKIAYPAHLEGLEAEAAAIAETSYATLSANLDVTFDRKIRLYLSDEDEIANGFAVPIGNGFTNIWVHVNEYASEWTGTEKWLRKVIAHELTHIFHYRAVRSRIGLLAYTLANPIPSFWAEGLAQYQTELWDAQRGDRWLRTAVLQDRLSYLDGRSIWNGRLRYAVGNAQVRYFAEQYGDSTLVRMLKHRKGLLFGLIKVHDFRTAFRATTGRPYAAFASDWRRHVNIYYNTLASQLEPLDSLKTNPLQLPGQYHYDVRYSPDGSQIAVLALESLDRPIRRLYIVQNDERRSARVVAEGSIQVPLAWSPDGQRLAYTRRVRGTNGALINDLFMVRADGGKPQRLTRNRRASSPSFSPEGERLAFVGVENETANVFILDLQRRLESQVTPFIGDVQISRVQWHPTDERLALTCFDLTGHRDVRVLDLATEHMTSVTEGPHDYRDPVWSPDGTQLAVSSLQDDVPNVFIVDVERRLASRFPTAPLPHTRRVTHLAMGGKIMDWLPASPKHSLGELVVNATNVKSRDFTYRLPATRTAPPLSPELPKAYSGWTDHRPPQEVPPSIAPNPSLIQERYAYNSWQNLTHVFSGALPYFNGRDDWGLALGTTWTEPLGKHALAFYGGLALRGTKENSGFLGSYINNQLSPMIVLKAYRFPTSAKVYGDGLLIQRITGATIGAYWPLDWTDRPYVSHRFGMNFRYNYIEPINADQLELTDDLPEPVTTHQRAATVLFRRRVRRPYRHNLIHPLDGSGFQAKFTFASRGIGSAGNYVRPDLSAYRVLPGPGLTRLLWYGRTQLQFGTSLPQDFIGFGRYDSFSLIPPGYSSPVRLGTSERVRGYRHYVLGTHMVFTSLEYRIPLLPDLQTRLLGLVDLGFTSLTLFADGGVVWARQTFTQGTRQLGLGVELKNVVRVAGFDLLHAIGVAQPYDGLGDSDFDLHYRIKASIPF